VVGTQYASKLNELEASYNSIYQQKQTTITRLLNGIRSDDEVSIHSSKIDYYSFKKQEDSIRSEVKKTISTALPGAKTQDRDYMFLNFVLSYLPHGIIGLILAVMFSAAMSSMASELNALASTTTVDIYKRSFNSEGSPAHYLKASRFFTIMWALIAMAFAMLANMAENLIQFVNIVGSLFYGTILGIFLVAFYMKAIRGTSVFIAAVIAELVVLACYFFYYDEIAFLYYNIIGCVLVVMIAWIAHFFDKGSEQKKATI
jgi:solute:Na+ symporter, SSS family